MKQEQLLEAIGGVDENMLMETERSIHPSSEMIRRITLVAAMVALLAITAVATIVGVDWFRKEQIVQNPSFDNIITGSGTTIYVDGFVYYGAPGHIYRLDPKTGETKDYPLEDHRVHPFYLFATDQYIGFVDTWHRVMAMTYDGKHTEVIMENDSFSHAYIDGKYMYTNDGAYFDRVNLETGERDRILENVSYYALDDTYIYAIPVGEGNYYLRSRKDTVSFEQIALPFHASRIYVNDGELCFGYYDQTKEGATYSAIYYQDGEEILLPFHAYFLQRLDDDVIYLDADDAKNAVKCYNLKTGETTVLLENVYEFSVLDDRFVFFDLYNADSVILNRETGEYTAFDTYG